MSGGSPSLTNCLVCRISCLVLLFGWGKMWSGSTQGWSVWTSSNGSCPTVPQSGWRWGSSLWKGEAFWTHKLNLILLAEARGFSIEMPLFFLVILLVMAPVFTKMTPIVWFFYCLPQFSFWFPRAFRNAISPFCILTTIAAVFSDCSIWLSFLQIEVPIGTQGYLECCWPFSDSLEVIVGSF